MIHLLPGYTRLTAPSQAEGVSVDRQFAGGRTLHGSLVKPSGPGGGLHYLGKHYLVYIINYIYIVEYITILWIYTTIYWYINIYFLFFALNTIEYIYVLFNIPLAYMIWSSSKLEVPFWRMLVWLWHKDSLKLSGRFFFCCDSNRGFLRRLGHYRQ